MTMIAGILAAAVLQAQAPVVADDAAVTAVATRARKVLKRCGAAGVNLAAMPNSAWRSDTEAWTQHRALRKALAEPMPDDPTMIAVYAAGGHLETTEFSVIVTKRPDGSWTGTAVGRSKIWVADAPSNTIPRKSWMLSQADGRRLDAIVGDKCLFAEPHGFARLEDGPPPLGALFLRLDVITPKARYSAGFLGGSAKGLAGEVTSLVLPD